MGWRGEANRKFSQILLWTQPASRLHWTVCKQNVTLCQLTRVYSLMGLQVRTLRVDFSTPCNRTNKNMNNTTEHKFAQYNQQDATFHNLFISVRRSTCFRRVFRPSAVAQNCTYTVRPILLPAASLVRLAAGSSCILLVVPCDYISDARNYEC